MQTYPSTPEAVDILSEENEVIFYDPASNWQRLANWLLDMVAYYFTLFLVSVFIGIGFVMSGSETYEQAIDEQSDLFYNLLFIGSYVLFMTVFEGLTKGRSLGKWITRTKVITLDGRPISFRQAFLRSLSRMVPFEVLSIFFSGAPWHDQWTNTQVIKINRF